MKLRELEAAHRRRLAACFLLVVVTGAVFLSYAVITLYQDKMAEHEYWDNSFTESDYLKEEVAQRSQNAIQVQTGTYIENLKEISLKTSSFRLVMLIWFKWKGSGDLDMASNFKVYKGTINKMETVKDYHKGDENYQLVRADITVTKNYWTRRFPLESHQLRTYLESNYPVEQVVLQADTENSGFNPNLSVAGYSLRRYGTDICSVKYENNHSDPEIKGNVITNEFMTEFEINRSDWGLYVKCFIALFGTSTWVLIVLFLNTYHRVDPLSMIPAALFGTVSNIMVGANLLPDALEVGLLEYVNIWGIFTILAVTISVINVNRIRNKFEDRDFAKFFGRVMFYSIIALTLIGHILMPIASYMFG